MQTGIVRVRDFHGTDDTGWTLDLRHGADDTLTAGRWRISLLTDGPGTVTVPWTGPTMRLAPRAPGYAAAVARTQILDSPIKGSNRQPLTVKGTRNLTVSSLGFGKVRVFYGFLSACVALPGDVCGSASHSAGDGGFGPGLISYPTQDASIQFTIQYGPGMIKPGRYDALQDVTDVATLQFATGAAFTLELV